MKTDETCYDSLRLENQLCFPLYAAAKEVVKKYNPFLSEIALTYTQYIAMMVLWDKQEISVKELGEYLFLDSGTLTPLLKALEKKGFVTRQRSESDERVLIVKITDEGMKLREKAVLIPQQVGSCVKIDEDEANELYRILYKILGGLKND
ncbi:MAG: MarR family transcriptional regulator [Oscillospiraceae bacterium]|nr:MarR family transcriptional regulator [Oscillospiraceae bacterium]